MGRFFRFCVFSLFALLIIGSVGGVLLVRSWNPSAPDAQIFVGGPIFTVNATNDIAEAVLVEGDRITLVGTAANVKSAAPKNAIVHDLAGKALMPGFIDAHGHYPGWGVFAVMADLASPPVGNVTSIADLQKKIAAKVSDAAPGEWVGGMGYDDTLIAEMRHPTAADLDAVSPENPVVIIHVSGHMLVANTLAMQAMGFTKDTVSPEGGEIVKDAEGNLTGLMKENAGAPFTSQILAFKPMQILGILNAGNADYLAKGVTTAQNGLSDKAMFEPLGLLAALGYTPIRVTSLVEASYALDLHQAGTLYDYESDMYHVAGVKIITDGSIQGYTGYLGKPYYVPHHAHGPGYRGYPTINMERLRELVSGSMKAGLRPFMHGNGDASIDMILDAVEHGQAEVPDAKSIWPVIIHAQMMRSDQIMRAKQLSVSPSFFSAHVYYWGDRHKYIFMGPKRAARMSPMRETQDANVPFTVHLDTPIVPMDPWTMIWSSIERQTSGGDILGAEQGISLNQAIRATTIDAAWQAGMDDKIGSIEAGKYADLIIVDQDPRSATDLRSIKTVKTFVGGVERYSATAQ